MDYQIH